MGSLKKESAELCFVTLALGAPYRLMALRLSEDLRRYAPGKQLVVATDLPAEFYGRENVRAFAHARVGLFSCINDKRCAISFALENHAKTALFLDADTRIHQALPPEVEVKAPLMTVYAPNLADQMEKYLSKRDRTAVAQAAQLFGVEPRSTLFVWDNLFAVTCDSDREKVFFGTWFVLTSFFDFQGVSITDGYCMALAAAVTGWTPLEDGLQKFEKARSHAGASECRASPLLIRALTRMTTWRRWKSFRRKTLRKLQA
jgi:hypothetical protein